MNIILEIIKIKKKLDKLYCLLPGIGQASEVDPTVPQHVKDISQSDIENWDRTLEKEVILTESTAYGAVNDTQKVFNANIAAVVLTNAANKANKNGDNITNSTTWRQALDLYKTSEIDNKFQQDGLESVTALVSAVLTANVLSISYRAENNIVQTVAVNLSTLVTNDISIEDASYDAGTNVITLTDSEGQTFTVDLSEFSIVATTDENGVTTLTQEAVTKLIVSKVGQTGQYSDLVGKPKDQDNIVNIIEISLSDILMTADNTQEEIQQALSTYIEGTVIDEKELYAIKLIGFPDVVNSFVTTNTAQTIDEVKEFSKGITIKGYKYFSDSAKNLTIAGKNIFGNNYGEITDSAIGIGNEIFPVMDLSPYDSETEPWNNKGYLGVGSALFINYIGNTNYRPAHNAHDSWVGVGRALGFGFIDGTNVTMIGTTNMHKNDVDYADSVTVIGKGNSNGVSANGIPLDKNRVTQSKNGVNLRALMNNVVVIGHENWIEDISQSIIVGSNTRPWSYIYNSLILGNNNSNWNVVVDPTKPKVGLDSDVIIGMGNWKRYPRHNESHNLLIGMDYAYATGSPPNFNYRSLVEGLFKGKTKSDSASLQVNGVLIAGHEKVDTDTPNQVDAGFNVAGALPEGVTFDGEGNFTFDGSQASSSFKIGDITITPDEAYYATIHASPHTAGSWGYSVNGSTDSGNTAGLNYTAVLSFIPSMNSDFILTTADNFQGVITVVFKKTNLFGDAIVPNIVLKDSYENTTAELRGGTLENGHLGVGLNAGKFLYLGTNTITIGKNAYAKATLARNSIIVGVNTAKNNSSSNRDVLIGYRVFENAFLGSGGNVLIGTEIIVNPTIRITNTTGVGDSAFTALAGGLKNTGIGALVGRFLTTGSDNLLAGYGSGLFKYGSRNTFLGTSTGGTGLTTSTINDTIVIGYNCVPESLLGNTTTIGTVANTDTYLYGTVHANSYKIRGGDGTKVLLDDGTTIAKTMLSSKMDYSLVEQNTGTKWIDGNWIFTITKLSTDPAPATDVRFPDEIVGLYTIYKYTKSA